MTHLRCLAPGLLLAALLAAAPAGAQPVDAQALGEAQALFDSAEKLMAADRFDEACPKLEEVVRLVPSGVGAKMALARCYEEGGRLASAWGAYLVAENAAITAGQADRAKTAADRAAELKPRLSTLAIAAPPGLRGVAGLEVKRDGKTVRQAEWGVAVPVDAGAHAITATAPGKKPWQSTAEVKGEASPTSVELPAQLEDAPAGEPPPRVKEPAPPPPAPAVPKPHGPPRVGVGRRGVGVALAAVSAGFLIDERAAQANIDSNCPGEKACVAGFDAAGANARLYRDAGVFIRRRRGRRRRDRGGHRRPRGPVAAQGDNRVRGSVDPAAVGGARPGGPRVGGRVLMRRQHGIVGSFLAGAALLAGCINPAPEGADTLLMCGGGVFVDPSADPHNCGACGHDCQGTVCSRARASRWSSSRAS